MASMLDEISMGSAAAIAPGLPTWIERRLRNEIVSGAATGEVSLPAVATVAGAFVIGLSIAPIVQEAHARVLRDAGVELAKAGSLDVSMQNIALEPPGDLTALLSLLVSRESATRKIDAFARLEPSWAGPDTELPTPTIREQAKVFLRQLPYDVPTPHVSPTADGQIGFEWETRRDFFAVDFAPNSVIWHHRRDRKLAAGDEAVWKGVIPPVLLDRLSRSFG